MATSLVVLTTGGRSYTDARTVARVMSALDLAIVIQGRAKGADALVRAWCKANDVICADVPAIWRPRSTDVIDFSAGPKRNAAMLRLKPNLVVAFPGHRGTKDMVKRALAAKIPVQVVD